MEDNKNTVDEKVALMFRVICEKLDLELELVVTALTDMEASDRNSILEQILKADTDEEQAAARVAFNELLGKI